MPVLKNPRWEVFAQARAAGMEQKEAYLLAGFKSKEASISQNAWRLANTAAVIARVTELQEAMIDRLHLPRERIALFLLADRELARANNNASAAVSASIGLAKLMGLMVDKSITLNVHKYDQMSPEELMYEFTDMITQLRAYNNLPDPETGKVPVIEDKRKPN